jgi:hypothetical protein
MKNIVCHSGGCPGADMTWETVGEAYGVKTISYSFEGHTQYGKNRKILTPDELVEGFEMVIRANATVKRYPQGQPTYVKNLLARNWFQVKNSEAIFAIGKFDKTAQVAGGTGWAVQMAIDEKKPVFVFEQPNKTWFFFSYEHNMFWPHQNSPKLTENFAGIGTREITDDGIQAVMDIFTLNFKE